MNEQLQAELLKIVTNINNGAESVWGFLTDQTPEVIRQLLLWHGIYSLILTLLGVGILVGVFCFNYRLFKWFSKLSEQKQREHEGTVIVFMLQIFWLIPLSFLINLTWLKIWLAPKVWLLEYITAMVK